MRSLLGVHASIAKGLADSINIGTALGCTALQIFTHSNRQWKFIPPSEKECDLFIQAQKKSEIKEVIIHASYLLNCASFDKEISKKSIAQLEQEILVADQLQIKKIVLHPGARLHASSQNAIEQCAEVINTVIDRTSLSSTSILIETMAGQGSTIGSTLEEIATLINTIEQKKRIGICIDTCHVFAAGYDIRTKSGYDEFFRLVDQIIGISYIQAIHLNDSLKDINSRIDRHTHIGEGKLGITPFSLIMNDERFVDIPKILETPKDADLKDDKKNLSLLKSLMA